MNTKLLVILVVVNGAISHPFTDDADEKLNIAFLTEQANKFHTIANAEVKLDCVAQREKAKSKSPTNFLPTCQNKNPALYAKTQCHQDSRVCWCVDELSGEPFSDCKGRRRAKFYSRVLNSLKTEMIMSGGSGNVTDERVLQWKFDALDKNKNKNIERREWKPYKELLRGWRKVKTCSRNFFRFCDLDGNRRVTLDEWKECTEQALAEVDPKHTNPFLHILKPDL
ncbi:unnamed protein product, partial [Mesorhabditis spiculigera]